MTAETTEIEKLSDDYVHFKDFGIRCHLCEYVECHGFKCREQCYGSGGDHCISCFPYKHYVECRACVIVDCVGEECDLSHDDGNFVHCERCHGKYHQSDPVGHTIKLVARSKLKIIDCGLDGYDRCGVHHLGKGNRRIHCIRCFPVDSEWTKRLHQDEKYVAYFLKKMELKRQYREEK